MVLATGLLDKPTREETLFGLLMHNKTLFLRHFWTTELPAGSLPTAKQVMMFQDTSIQQAVVSGRKVLKSTFIESMVIGLGMRHTGGHVDGFFTTPAQAHMDPMLLRIEDKIDNTPLFAAMKDKWTHDDNILRFKSGRWWIFRVEGVDGSGRNMVGIRADIIICDEAAFGAFKAHDARIGVALDPIKTKWLYTGVPNGVRLTPFWRIDQDKDFGKSWSVHRFTQMENPAFNTPEAKEKMREQYKDENEYLNNVMGQWGEERASSFPSEHLNASQADDQPWCTVTVTDTIYHETVAGAGSTRGAWFSLLSRVAATAALVGNRADMALLGSDFGYSPDPTECYVVYRDALYTERSGIEVWRGLSRITLRRLTATEQAECIDVLRVDILNRSLGGTVRHICADMQGYGNAVFADALFTDKRYDVEWYRGHSTAAAFGATESRLDEYDQPETDRDGKIIKKRRKQTSTEMLKDLFAANAGLGAASRFIA